MITADRNEAGGREFLIDIQVEDLEYLDSFASILEYLRAKIDD